MAGDLALFAAGGIGGVWLDIRICGHQVRVLPRHLARPPTGRDRHVDVARTGVCSIDVAVGRNDECGQILEAWHGYLTFVVAGLRPWCGYL
jgi:hypothetical protein